MKKLSEEIHFDEELLSNSKLPRARRIEELIAVKGILKQSINHGLIAKKILVRNYKLMTRVILYGRKGKMPILNQVKVIFKDNKFILEYNNGAIYFRN